MSKLAKIKSPVEGEMEVFKKEFAKILKSKIPLLNIILQYVLKTKGKQIRPLLVFLSARLFGQSNSTTYTAAALVELLHTATLIHDDVVDESYERRGLFSIKALWKSKVAVLLGDYLLAQGLLLAVRTKNYNLLETVSHAVEEMSEGELLQIQKSRQLNITEEQYFEIIRKKTAALIAACSSCGAQSITKNASDIKKMYDLGMHLGIAFQIKDDLIDYDMNSISGKPAGNDIKEKKLTLPLIYALEKTDKKNKKNILTLISKNKKGGLKTILDFVANSGGLEYATIKMQEHQQKAKDILNEFEDGEIKNSFLMLVDYIIERKK